MKDSSRGLKLKRWTLVMKRFLMFLNDDDHELFEDYMEIDGTKSETTRTRGGRVIKRPYAPG